MDFVNLRQWPAMAVTITATRLVALTTPRRTTLASGCFSDNGLQVAWGLHVDASALIAMQVSLATMNILGRNKDGVYWC